jgi:predicted DNA-binding transcriptional regulator YafY
LILNLLRSRRSLNTSDLAKECEVSERTIFRDIRALSEARVPIYFDHGYRLLTDAFLPPLNLTVDELLTIYLGLNSELVQSVKSLRKSAKQVLAKLESLIPEKIRTDYEKAKEQITVQPENKPSRQSMVLIFELLRQAISLERKVKIDCSSSESSQTIWLVPKALLYKRGSWHLVFERQNKKKYLRLDRIKKVSYS